MKRASSGKSAFDLIEEATHLLRTGGSGLLAYYYGGAVPFVLGLLYFWADMSRNPFADEHVAEAALGIAVLFLWMKFWQAVFALRVRAIIASEPPPKLHFREIFRIALAQTILQPIGLLPIGLCVVGLFYFAPVGLMFAAATGFLLPFFHNVTALANGQDSSPAAILKKAWRLSLLWPGQNLIMLAVCYFFGLYVFLNWSILGLTLPGLIKMLFSVESDFTRNPFSMLNSTFFAAMFGLTYLSVDPILKTLYALRCFYGDAVKSGEDLKADLKRAALSSQALAVAAVLLVIVFGATPLSAADAPPQDSRLEAPSAVNTRSIGKVESIPAPDLDHAINQTIHERKYAWRMPRDKAVVNGKEGIIGRFLDKISNLFRKWVNAALDWLVELLRKLFGHRVVGHGAGAGQGWITASQALLFVLLAVVACALGVFIYRVLQGRRQPALTASQPLPSTPDISDENVGADQLPEDGWTQLARELLARGEFRLAMRAFYLASLAHLARRNFISIARFKSNRDYERELRRRAHSFPELLLVFGDNLSLFERIWYGAHEANGETVTHFAANVERIKGAG